MLYFTGFSVNDFCCPDDPGSKGISYCLMPETDAKDWYFASKMPDQLHCNPGVLRPPWAGGNDNPLRGHILNT